MQDHTPTWEQWDSFLQWLLIEKKFSDKVSAIAADRSRYKAITEYFRDKEFNRENFRTYLTYLQTTGLKNSTRNKYITMAKNIDIYLNAGVLSGFTYFDEERPQSEIPLSPEEIVRLADVWYQYGKESNYINARQKALIMLLGTTGCRIGEALSLTKDDIYPNTPHIFFKKTKNFSDREVPISHDLLKMIQDIMLPRGYIFMSSRGGLLESPQVNYDLKMRARMINLENPDKVHTHLLRKSYIQTMLEAGAEWFELSVIVGHKDPKTTLRYYNSLMTRKVEITNMHPLLKKQLTWNTTKKYIRDYVNKVIYTHSHNVEWVENGEESITVRITRLVQT